MSRLPGGTKQADVTIDGRSYTPYSSAIGYAFVPKTTYFSGTQDIKAFIDYLKTANYLPAGTMITQLCYGFDLVSTGNKQSTFLVSNFEVLQE
jgi:hypothetical protein